MKMSEPRISERENSFSSKRLNLMANLDHLFGFIYLPHLISHMFHQTWTI